MLNTIQKPEKLMERLIKASSNPGDLVFDPFCGSGTVPAVCHRLGRRFVACEINPEYRRLAEERLANVTNGSETEGELFSQKPARQRGRHEIVQAGLL
jgi:DNA modification methylase